MFSNHKALFTFQIENNRNPIVDSAYHLFVEVECIHFFVDKSKQNIISLPTEKKTGRLLNQGFFLTCYQINNIT